MTKGIEGRISVSVILGGRKTGQKPPKRRRVWIDDEVEILAAPWHTVERARRTTRRPCVGCRQRPAWSTNEPKSRRRRGRSWLDQRAPAKPFRRDRPRRARDGARDRLLLPCTPGASSGYRRVSALACPRTGSQRGVRGLRARDGGRPPSAQRGSRASCHWHAPRHYTKTQRAATLTRGMMRGIVSSLLPSRVCRRRPRRWRCAPGRSGRRRPGLHPRWTTMTVASSHACAWRSSIAQSALSSPGVARRSCSTRPSWPRVSSPLASASVTPSVARMNPSPGASRTVVSA